MSEHSASGSGYLPKNVDPSSSTSKSPTRSMSGSLARGRNRGSNTDLSSHSGHRGDTDSSGGGKRTPSSRLLMTAPERRGRLPKRTQSFKRTSVAQGALASQGIDLEQLASMDSSNQPRASSLKPPPTRGSTGGATMTTSALGGVGLSTTSTSNFVKNFLEEDDNTDLLGIGGSGSGRAHGRGGRGGSPPDDANNGLQFDADTQRNVHRNLLSPSSPSPGNSPENRRSVIGNSSRMSMSGYSHGDQYSSSRHSHGSQPQQNLFQQRDDFYNVDQSVNLMDAEAGKYESKRNKNKKSGSGMMGGHSPSSMVEIFLKDSNATDGTHNKKGRQSSLLWGQPPNAGGGNGRSTWETIKEVAARLLIPLFCCAIFAVVILAIVLIYQTTADAVESVLEATPKPTSVPVAIPAPAPAPAQQEQDQLVQDQEPINTDGMTESMASISKVLGDLQVLHNSKALQDKKSAPYQALDWISKDEIALQSIADSNAGRRNRQRELQSYDLSKTQERLVQRYALAVAYYSWGGMTNKPEDLAASALSNMDDLGTSIHKPTHNHAGTSVWLTADSECTWRGIECHTHTSTAQMIGEAPDRAHGTGTQIRSLNLTGHGLEGTLPPELTSLRHMVTLDLRHNSLTGTLDDIDWDKWNHMEYLLLGSNKFSGNIPNSLSELERCIDIDLGDNEFSGPLPALTGGKQMMDALNNMFLDANQLTGSIPESFLEDMPNLRYLDLTDNKLTGPIPSVITQMNQLKYFRAVNNSLTGNLPPGMASMAHLDTIAVDNNKLKGKLEKGMFNQLTRLRFLQLNGNSFSGPLPESVAGLNYLMNLDLSSNKFTGTIPSKWFEGGTNKALMSIRLNENKLTGTVPASIGNLANSLEDFRVSDNDLSGELPDGIGELSELRYCELSSNGFVGSIPATWAGMAQLEDLDLSHNKLTGIVPEELCDMERANEGSELPVTIIVDCKSGDITCDCCEKCL